MAGYLSRLERRANNANVVGSTPTLANLFYVKGGNCGINSFNQGFYLRLTFERIETGIGGFHE